MIEISLSNFLSTLAIVLTIISMLVGYFKFALGFIGKLEAVKLNFTERLTKVETKMDIFMAPMINVLVSKIKQPIHVEKDGLLDKLNGQAKNMTILELTNLKHILEDEMTGKDTNEKWQYAFLLGRIDMVLLDRGCL